MAKLSRQTLVQFGRDGGSSNFGQFGSQAASAPVETKDISTLQALAAYTEGWQDAVALGQAPYLQDMNTLFYVLCYELCYAFQEGIPEYDAGTTYFIGGVVKVLNTNYTEFYVSLGDNNTGNTPPTRTTDSHWQFLYAKKTGSGLIIEGTQTNDAPPQYAVGESVSASAVNQAVPANSVLGDLCSIDLTPGLWEVAGGVAFIVNGATITGVQIGISSHAGNDSTGLAGGDTAASGPPPTVAYATTPYLAGVLFQLAVPTTIYLKMSVIYSAGAPQASGRIRAWRRF